MRRRQADILEGFNPADAMLRCRARVLAGHDIALEIDGEIARSVHPAFLSKRGGRARLRNGAEEFVDLGPHRGDRHGLPTHHLPEYCFAVGAMLLVRGRR